MEAVATTKEEKKICQNELKAISINWIQGETFPDRFARRCSFILFYFFSLLARTCGGLFALHYGELIY